jgi:hypothetical protein
MNQLQRDIDAGHTLLTLTMENSRRGLLVTAYVNSISIRSSAIRFARVADNFIDATVCACGFPDDSFSEAHMVRVAHEMHDFIDEILNQQKN